MEQDRIILGVIGVWRSHSGLLEIAYETIMTILQSFILGVLQGLTEFLPVSSSGHLVIAESLLNLSVPVEALQGFDVLLHAGSGLALLIIYRKLWTGMLLSLTRRSGEERKTLVALVFATIPAGIAGVLLEETIASHFRSPSSVALSLIVTAFVLYLGEQMKGHKSLTGVRLSQALGIGCAQALALVPGLSRSGLTISAGRASGLSRHEALDFSFLMALPIIAGATVLTMHDIMKGTVHIPAFSIAITGVLSSFAASILAITLLRTLVLRHSLIWFAPYLLSVAVLLLFFT